MGDFVDMLFQVRDQATKILVLRVRLLYISPETTKDNKVPIYVRVWDEHVLIDNYIDKSRWLCDESDELEMPQEPPMLDDDISEADFLKKTWKYRDEVHPPKQIPSSVWHKYLKDETTKD